MRRFVVVIFVAIFLVALLAIALAASKIDALEEMCYSVRPGECLWDIAGKFCPEGMDRWTYINMIADLNDLQSSCIHPYQKIIVLVEGD